MKKHTKADIKRIEDRLRKIKKTKVEEKCAEDTSTEVQKPEESVWQFSDFGSISIYPLRKEGSK